MFYNASNIPQGIYKASIVPRPIAWISSVNKAGHHNLAPFSYFNIVSDEPPMLMFSTTGSHIEGGAKDTLKNIEEQGEFIVNLVSFSSKEHMNYTSLDFPADADEFDAIGIAYTKGELVNARRVIESPISLECIYHQSIQLPVNDGADLINRMILGRVVGMHVNPNILTDNRIDMDKYQVIARIGYNSYLKGTDYFEMKRPNGID